MSTPGSPCLGVSVAVVMAVRGVMAVAGAVVVNTAPVVVIQAVAAPGKLYFTKYLLICHKLLFTSFPLAHKN